MSNGFVVTTESRRRAMLGVAELTIESQVTANLISMFRNTFPAIQNYVKDVVAEFTSHDETEFNFVKASSEFRKAEETVRNFNFVQFGQTVLQTPEGFKGEYVEYLNWLISHASEFVHSTHAALTDYYLTLSRVISSHEAKISQKDNSPTYAVMEKKLEATKTELGSFFDSRTNNALRTADSLFGRGADILETMELTKKLNKERLTFKTKEITEITKQISDMINLLVDASETGKIPELSGATARSIAQGALVAAHYVEMVGVLRYRIEECINAVGAMAHQVAQHK